MQPTPRPNKAIVTALWANAALLALIALMLFNRNGGPNFLPTALAQNQQPIAGGGGVFIMPGQMQINTWGCYLLDVDSKTLCTYQFSPGEHKLRLTSARSYRYDTKLANFNTDPPPNEMKQLVEKQEAAKNQGIVPSSDPKIDK